MSQTSAAVQAPTVDRPGVPSAAMGMRPSHSRRARWEYVGLMVLLVGTAVTYLCNLGANRWANSFYAAAAQAGSVSWKTFAFGSSDGGNSITVDKIPASLWPMALSIRLFGLNSWSLLVPQVLMGVGTVALLWATVRRSFGAAAGLLTGLVLAVTPVAALMFRYDNPDALLVLVMVAAAWAMTRAVEDGRTRWLVLCGVLVGFGFLVKQLQVLLVVPALALTYLVAGPPRLGIRLAQLLGAGAGVVAGAGWWMLVAQLWPTGSRPYFGGSQHNSILELTLGYNGVGRLNGAASNDIDWFVHDAGALRLFRSAQGGQIAWLLAAAILLLIAGIVLCGRAERGDPRGASFLLWGSWLVVTGLVFSFMKGIFHQYYTVALAPAIAALIGSGAIVVWRHRTRIWVRGVALAAYGTVVATAWVLLSRTASFVPWLRWVVLVGGIAVAIGLLQPARGRTAVAIAMAAAATGLAGPLAYTVNTLATPHTGAIPVAGPALPILIGPCEKDGQPSNDPANCSTQGGADLTYSLPPQSLVDVLKDNGGHYTWAAATINAESAAPYQLGTELPVMPIGGFLGQDPSPTLEQFQRYVTQRRIHYFIPGDSDPPDGPDDTSAAKITAWVTTHFTARLVAGTTLYDLTRQR